MDLCVYISVCFLLFIICPAFLHFPSSPPSLFSTHQQIQQSLPRFTFYQHTRNRFDSRVFHSEATLKASQLSMSEPQRQGNFIYALVQFHLIHILSPSWHLCTVIYEAQLHCHKQKQTGICSRL